MRAIRIMAVIVLLIGTPIYIAYRPESYSPLLETVFNVGLFLLSFGLGREDQKADIAFAKQEGYFQATQHWLPQAASACRGLQTLRKSVMSFRAELAAMCAVVARDLPQLENANMRGLKTALDGRCNSGAQRLDDIANHLQDSIADWERFIRANCAGPDCDQMESELSGHAAELQAQLAPCPSPADSSIENTTVEPAVPQSPA